MKVRDVPVGRYHHRITTWGPGPSRRAARPSGARGGL